jgi:hypothetical protein
VGYGPYSTHVLPVPQIHSLTLALLKFLLAIILTINFHDDLVRTGQLAPRCTELLEAVDMFSFCFDFAFNKSLSCLDKRAKDGKGIIN